MMWIWIRIRSDPKLFIRSETRSGSEKNHFVPGSVQLQIQNMKLKENNSGKLLKFTFSQQQNSYCIFHKKIPIKRGKLEKTESPINKSLYLVSCSGSVTFWNRSGSGTHLVVISRTNWGDKKVKFM
jgi:hypothetical protein